MALNAFGNDLTTANRMSAAADQMKADRMGMVEDITKMGGNF